MKKCHNRWLIIYDDSPEIRELFDFANITEWILQYRMNNYKQTSAAKGQELLALLISVCNKALSFKAS